MENQTTKISDDYIKAAIIHGQATMEGNNRLANKKYSILTKFFKQFEKDNNLGNEILKPLLTHQDVSVRLWAASHALGLNIEIEKAQKVLKVILANKDIGIIAFDAKMTLQQWEKNGYLKF